MNESTKRALHGIAYYVIGAFIVGASGYLAVDSWATMSQIEAQGVLGQAAFQNEYEQAAGMLKLAVPGLLIGLLIALNGVAEDIKSALYELGE